MSRLKRDLTKHNYWSCTEIAVKFVALHLFKTSAPGEARTLNLRIAKPVLLISTTR